MNNNEDRAVRKVIIDPGHGGTDSGATGNNLLEKDYNLLISKYMYDRFKELGIPVAPILFRMFLARVSLFLRA